MRCANPRPSISPSWQHASRNPAEKTGAGPTAETESVEKAPSPRLDLDPWGRTDRSTGETSRAMSRLDETEDEGRCRVGQKTVSRVPTTIRKQRPEMKILESTSRWSASVRLCPHGDAAGAPRRTVRPPTESEPSGQPDLRYPVLATPGPGVLYPRRAGQRSSVRRRAPEAGPIPAICENALAVERPEDLESLRGQLQHPERSRAESSGTMSGPACRQT